MTNERTIARVAIGDNEAMSVCEGIRSALQLAGLPEDTVMPFHLSTGEHILALEITSEPVGDVAMLYTMIARVE